MYIFIVYIRTIYIYEMESELTNIIQNQPYMVDFV